MASPERFRQGHHWPRLLKTILHRNEGWNQGAAALVGAFKPSITAVVLRHFPAWLRAEFEPNDVLQETFTAFFSALWAGKLKLARLQTTGALRAFLSKTAHNNIRLRLRRYAVKVRRGVEPLTRIGPMEDGQLVSREVSPEVVAMAHEAEEQRRVRTGGRTASGTQGARGTEGAHCPPPPPKKTKRKRKV